MNNRLEAILGGISDADLARVAAGALRAEQVILDAATLAERVVTSNGDPRTLAIMRYSGTARVNGAQRAWSSVAKVIDLTVPPALSWIRVEAEVAVYRERLFTGGHDGFRPARCYHISEPVSQSVVLWLEDLTGVRKPPFRIDELARIVRHFGVWNAGAAQRPVPAALDLAGHSVFSRWDNWPLDREFADLRAMADGPEVTALFSGRGIGIALELRDALLAVVERARGLPRTLCFGDANIGNLFATPTETIAVDWAGLTFDPLGVDAGSVIGSAISWGGDAIAIAAGERELFESYLEGLLDGGYRGDRDDIRRGYLVHYGSYLMAQAMLPAFLKQFDRSRIERRVGVRYEDIFPRGAPIVDLMPGYLDELGRLAR